MHTVTLLRTYPAAGRLLERRVAADAYCKRPLFSRGGKSVRGVAFSTQSGAVGSGAEYEDSVRGVGLC